MLSATRSKSIAAEAASYNGRCSLAPFVGEAFMPEALRHAIEKHRG